MDSKYRYKLLQLFAPPFIDDGKEEPDSHVVECCVKIPVAVVYKKGIANIINTKVMTIIG